MNIAFDAGAIEIAKGSGVGNYTLNQFKAMIQLTPENNYYYFNTICKSELIEPLKNSNFFEVNYYMGKEDIIRNFDGEYKELYGKLVQNFLKKYQIDVFYITSPFLSENVMYEKEWFKDVVVVATAYDIIPYIMKDKYLNSKYLMKWYMACIDMLRWCDCQLAISQSVKDDMVHYLQFDPEKIEIIYGGVSGRYCIKTYSEEENSRLFNKFGIKNKFIMCGVSADQRKNISGAIQGYALLPQEIKKEIQLVIVGRVLQEALNQYREQINELGESENIILTNYVTDEELIQLYNCAELMLFPSLYEGFGLPLIEAWACGTPVAASNNSSLGELAKGAGVLFDPTDVKDIARALEEALTVTDLEKLLKIGRQKLDIFTWDNVAKLTLGAIEETCNKKQKTIEKKRNKIACILWDLSIYNNGWKQFFSVLAEYADITIVNPKEKEQPLNLPMEIGLKDFKRSLKKFDGIYHFVFSVMSQDVVEQLKRYKGIGVILDEYTLEKFALLGKSDFSDFEGLLNAKRIEKYFNKNIKECEVLKNKQLFDKIVVFNEKLKQECLEKLLEIEVFNIVPIDGEQKTIKFTNENLEKIGRNFLESGANEKKFYNLKQCLNKFLKEEIIAKTYSKEEIIHIAHTIGEAVSTEPSMELINKLFDEQEYEEKIKVDMVTTWNTKCGVAEFTRYFVENTLEQVEYLIFPDVTERLIRDDEEFVTERTWKQYDCDFNQLIEKLKNSESRIVHIQYNFGFFSLESLVTLIEQCPEKKVIIDFHATKMIEDKLSILNRKRIIRGLNNAYKIVVHQKEDIEELCRVGIKFENIQVIPLGQNICLDRKVEQCRKWLGIMSKHVIGSYGFMLPHKGIEKVIEAIALLKKSYPDILYIVSCALYDADVSKQYLMQCKDLAKSLGVDKNVIFINDFLSPNESEMILQSCDILAMVYSPTEESASGAIRFCMAAKRPILVTKQKIFNEYVDCTLQIETNDSQLIADAFETLFETDTSNYIQKMSEKVNETSWKTVGNKYIELYRMSLN